MSKRLKKQLQDKADKNKVKKEKMESKIYLDDWASYDLPNPFSVVHDFIKEKGLKLYGGLALHSHLKKHKAGLYKRYEFPDYDVLSPDAWNQAKELANRLHKMGFMFVEARQSVLNDYHHNTYKVSVDMMYLLDITQRGCTPEQFKKNDCDTCGRKKNGDCADLFNELPAYSLSYSKKSKNPKIYRKTYNKRTKKSYHPDKFFVMEPNWLKAQMFREMTEPLANPDRLPKIGTRLKTFQKYYPFDVHACSDLEYKKITNKHRPILDEIGRFIKNKSLINYGASAYNLFVKNSKGIGKLGVSNYKVYSVNPEFHKTNVMNLLKKAFPKTEFISYKRNMFWREHEDLETIVAVKENNKVNNLITITQHDHCMPYLQYNGIRYATIERLKYLYYSALSIPEFQRSVEDDPKNYHCLISNLMEAEKQYNKKNRKSKKKVKRSKFRKYVSRCQGDESSKIVGNLIDRWINKKQTLKTTKYYPNKPKKGYITKVSEMPKEELYLPFKPEEEEIKRKRK